MTTSSKQASPTAPETPPPTATLIERSPGIIYADLSKKNKKKKRYSRELKSLQQIERGFGKSSHRLSRAVARGLSVYRKRRDKSARKKKDGAIIDGALNWSKAFGKAMRVASNAPSDLAVQVNRTKLSRRVRNSLRTMSPMMFR